MIEDIKQPKFYGRRKGRKIHKAKSFLLENFLPLVLLDKGEKINFATIFGRERQKNCLEIGFGDGDHLAALVRREPNTGFIGVEVYQNGVANLLSLLTGIKESQDIGNLANPQEMVQRIDNLKIFADDVRLLFAAIPDESLDKVYLLFPDPWPKSRHAARRFVNQENLYELARILKKGGILQIATDHPVYKKWTLDVMHANRDFYWTAKCSDDWRNPPQDWAETKYQRKALREGRRPVFFEFQKL